MSQARQAMRRAGELRPEGMDAGSALSQAWDEVREGSPTESGDWTRLAIWLGGGYMVWCVVATVMSNGKVWAW